MTESHMSAIERARMVAAKLSAQIPDSNMATKRAADSSDDHSSSKKFASINDAVGANLAMLKAQNLSGAQSDEHRVPDKQVGLIIGRGGEQLRKIEAESQCKLNIAPDSNGLPDRIVTLIGTKDAIERAKRLIDEVLKRTPGHSHSHSHGMDQNGSMMKNGVEIFEMKVPGNKCGLVIGKGGETIKKLSEQYGVKLVVVQDSSTAPGADKPLRITGEPEKVSKAREAVLNLINPKDNNQSSTNEYGSSKNGSNQGEVFIKVPGDKAGIVIGKGGESIKDIKRRSGAHVEIDKSGRTPVEGNDKIFVIKGTNEQIQTAQQLIYEKITGVQGSQPPNGYFNNSTGQMPYGQQQQQPAATDGSNYNQWSGYQQGAVDPNMSAWQAYYQYYGQTGMQPGSATTTTTSSTVQPTINPQTGQADYSQAWVEYYRSLGMHEQADAILRQTQQS